MEITHDEKGERFVAKVNGEEAFTAYYEEGDTLNFHHTYVPEKLRNKGVAGKIVAAALNHVRQHNLKVIASCAFVEHFIENNPEYQDLVKK